MTTLTTDPLIPRTRPLDADQPYRGIDWETIVSTLAGARLIQTRRTEHLYRADERAITHISGVCLSQEIGVDGLPFVDEADNATEAIAEAHRLLELYLSVPIEVRDVYIAAAPRARDVEVRTQMAKMTQETRLSQLSLGDVVGPSYTTTPIRMYDGPVIPLAVTTAVEEKKEEQKAPVVSTALELINDPRLPHAYPPNENGIYSCVDWTRVLSTLVATGDIDVKPKLRNDGSVYALELVRIRGVAVPPELCESALMYADDDDVQQPGIACQLMEMYLGLSDEVRQAHLLTGVQWDKVVHKLRDAQILTTAPYNKDKGKKDEYIVTLQGTKPSELLVVSALGKPNSGLYQETMAKHLLQLFTGAIHDPACPSQFNAACESFR